MRKVSKEDFIRMPEGTLYSRIGTFDNDNWGAGLIIKTNTGYETSNSWGEKVWIFSGAMPLAPDVPLGQNCMETKWLDDYNLNEHICGEWIATDESTTDFEDDEEIMVYDKEDIERMISLLKECLENYE